MNLSSPSWLLLTLVLASFFSALPLAEAGIKPPSSAFGITELSEAKAKAASTNQPLTFVYTCLSSR